MSTLGKLFLNRLLQQRHGVIEKLLGDGRWQYGGHVSQRSSSICRVCRANRVFERVLVKATEWLGLCFRGTRRKNRRARGRRRRYERGLKVDRGSVKRRKNGERWIAAAD